MDNKKKEKQKINKRWVEQMHARLVMDYFEGKDERIRSLDVTNSLKEIAKLRDYYPVVTVSDVNNLPDNIKLDI